MSRASSWLRVCAGSALLICGAERTEAGELFRKCFGDCGASCPSQVIQLPAQQVVVETARPRVLMQETRIEKPLRVAHAVAPPSVVASIFVPMPLQVGVVPGVPITQHVIEERREAAPSISLESHALRMAHELEMNRLHMAKLQAVQEAEYQHMRAVMDRIAAQRAQAPQVGAAPTTDCCEEVKAQLRALAKKVDMIEQQVNLHDRAIRKDPTLVIPPPPK